MSALHHERRGPRQKLPPGRSRRQAQYLPAVAGPAGPPIVDVGGYDDLLSALDARAIDLAVTREGLEVIDALIDSNGIDLSRISITRWGSYTERRKHRE